MNLITSISIKSSRFKLMGKAVNILVFEDGSVVANTEADSVGYSVCMVSLGSGVVGLVDNTPKGTEFLFPAILVSEDFFGNILTREAHDVFVDNLNKIRKTLKTANDVFLTFPPYAGNLPEGTINSSWMYIETAEFSAMKTNPHIH